VSQPSDRCCCGGGAVDSAAVPDASAVCTEAEFAQLVAAGRGDPAHTGAFLGLLDERHPVYDGVGTPAVVRMRGALLLALGYRALPTAALPFVLEELESPHEAWLTAVAARILRNHPQPSAAFVAPLVSALFYIRQRDDIVRLDAYGGYGSEGEPTTAVAEVIRTLGWLGQAGARALPRLRELRDQEPGSTIAARLDEAIAAIQDDARLDTPERGAPASRVGDVCKAMTGDVAALVMQDQSGEVLSFRELFTGKPSIVVFFYTRCDNPTKCPLTIAKLGRLQQHLESAGHGDAIRTAAITYDPAYDLPQRLLQYARSWGASLGESHRMLRTVGDLAPLREFFDLGVNFGESGLVNRHQVEAFVLDSRGTIVHAVTRQRWEESQLLAAALGSLGEESSPPWRTTT
jgi:protein SCO1